MGSLIIVIDDFIQRTSYFHHVLSTEYRNEMIFIETIVGRGRGNPSEETLWQGSEDGSLRGGYGRNVDSPRVGRDGNNKDNIDCFGVSISTRSGRLDRSASPTLSFIKHGSKSLHFKDINVQMGRLGIRRSRDLANKEVISAIQESTRIVETSWPLNAKDGQG